MAARSVYQLLRSPRFLSLAEKDGNGR